MCKLRSAKEDAITEIEVGMMMTACVDLLDNLAIRLTLYAGLSHFPFIIKQHS